MIHEGPFIPGAILLRRLGFSQDFMQFPAHFFAIGLMSLGRRRIAQIETQLFRSEFEEIARLIHHICIQPVAALATLVPHQT